MNPLWSNIFRKKNEEDSLAYFLQNLAIFADLGRRELNFIETLVHPRHYAPAETVFEEGDPGTGMYAIRSGRVSIFVRKPDGQKVQLALLGPGDFFGESTLMAPARRTASARTLENTELIGLFRADLLESTQKHPAVTNTVLAGLARILSERLQAAEIELRQLRTTAAPAVPLPPADIEPET
ncbi:Crp/Fnr family transcriptional regulator [Trichloromonas sp.]|uniref:Crp/Fnr family transcriptional regulator n=1 Tax=Trichloromonas sp. TaxID=3069249 RepID=UPI003D81ADDD